MRLSNDSGQTAMSPEHRAYLISLAFKCVIGAAQLVAGFGLALVPTDTIRAYVSALARLELVQDPDDRAALWVQHAMAFLPVGEVHFYTVYLLIHGVLNVGLVAALLARLRWAYPVSILVLIGFVAYQVHEIYLGKGWMLWLLTAIDLFVIWLIRREWRTARRG